MLSVGTSQEQAQASDIVTVHSPGWSADGRMFDSSLTRGTPATFPLARVLPGWRECLQLMTVGESMRVWIPERLAYKGREPKGMLVFDVELMAIK